MVARGGLERGGEGVVGGVNSATVGGGGAQGDKSKGNLFMLAEADGGDGLGFRVPKKVKILLHAGPIPSAVNDVIKVGCLNLADQTGRVGKVILRWGVHQLEAITERKAQSPNPGDEIDPREKEPEPHPDDACTNARTEEIEGQKRGDEESEGSDFPQHNGPARPEGHSDDDTGKDNKEFGHSDLDLSA